MSIYNLEFWLVTRLDMPQGSPESVGLFISKDAAVETYEEFIEMGIPAAICSTRTECED
jgi:hypothetical protein